jgi:hypothetical protein
MIPSGGTILFGLRPDEADDLLAFRRLAKGRPALENQAGEVLVWATLLSQERIAGITLANLCTQLIAMDRLHRLLYNCNWPRASGCGALSQLFERHVSHRIMHPFPPAATLQCFVGDAIAQVWLDPYGVQFKFESRRWLAAELRIEQFEPDGTVWGYNCEAADGPPLILHRLLYRRIVAVEREDLRLTFRIEDGSALAILSDLGSYESGQIEAPETGYIVF